MMPEWGVAGQSPAFGGRRVFAKQIAPQGVSPLHRDLQHSPKPLFLNTVTIMAEEHPLILIADDDPDLRQLVRIQLEPMACRIIEANNGAAALENILVETPDLVILDVMMPELTGWEVLKYIRSHKETENIGVLMLTGIGETLNDLSSPMYGADDHIDKPFKAQELLFKVRRVLSKSRKRQQETDV
jgi:DNA-binding response OmpR family regulator